MMGNSKITLMVDSVSDLPESWRQQYDIKMVPLYVIFGETAYKDTVEITVPEMYRMVEERDEIPKTAAPSPGDFYQAFEQEINAGKDVLYISMSSKVSATYQNARLAAMDLPAERIHIVDSLHLSASYALLVIRAARALEQGRSITEVIKDIEKNRSKVEIDIIVDKLDFLSKGGRVSGVKHFIGNILKVHPVLKIIQGEVASVQKYRGKMGKAVDSIAQYIVENREHICPSLIVIAQTMAENTAERIRSYLMEHGLFKEVVIVEGGCTICAHTGPNSIAVSYLATGFR